VLGSEEHTYVIEGELQMGDVRVRAGDALWSEPGETHVVHAITDALFLGVAPPR
jgi:quercetin dioxygenase-like cupin family protein